MEDWRFTGAAIAGSRAERLLGALAFGGGYPLLLGLTFLMEVRWSIASALSASDVGVLAWLDHVNYLPIAEWLCILDIAHEADCRGCPRVASNAWRASPSRFTQAHLSPPAPII